MAGSKTDAYANDLLKWATGQACSIIPNTPNTPKLALYTTMPTASSAGVEVSGGGYARITATGIWGTPSAGSITNTTRGPFATAVTTDWGTIVGGGLWTTSGSQLLYFGPLTDAVGGTISKFIGVGDTFAFEAGQITFTEH